MNLGSKSFLRLVPRAQVQTRVSQEKDELNWCYMELHRPTGASASDTQHRTFLSEPGSSVADEEVQRLPTGLEIPRESRDAREGREVELHELDALQTRGGATLPEPRSEFRFHRLQCLNKWTSLLGAIFRERTTSKTKRGAVSSNVASIFSKQTA